MKMRTRVIVTLGAVAALLAGFSGAAYAADGAIPGDALYGFDRALENVGIGDGGVQERLMEATRLAEQGEVDECLDHAALAFADQAGLDEDGQANAALIAAANAVQTANQGESSEIRSRVAEMMRWMATTQAQGEDYGQGVAERAREISGTCEQDQNTQLEREQNGEQNHKQEQDGALNRNGQTGGAR